MQAMIRIPSLAPIIKDFLALPSLATSVVGGSLKFLPTAGFRSAPSCKSVRFGLQFISRK
jgi:hypothetical protein